MHETALGKSVSGGRERRGRARRSPRPLKFESDNLARTSRSVSPALLGALVKLAVRIVAAQPVADMSILSTRDIRTNKRAD